MASRIEGSAGRALALAAFLFLAAVALRGYLPGAERAAREPSTDNPAAMVVVVVLLLASVGIVTVAVVVHARNKSAGRGGTAARPDWLRRDVGRPSWRATLIAFAVVLVWMLVALQLSRLGGGGASAPAFVPGTSPESAPPPSGPTADAPRPPAPQADSSLLGYFYAGTVIFLVVLVVGTIVTSRRSHRSAVPGEQFDDVARAHPPESDSESLVRAAEVGLAEVEDLSREPRKAIIACYAAMERELARVPGAAPQDFDTASEVLERAVQLHALRPDNATQLVELFDEARFSPHVMNEGHRETAVEVLQQVLAELPSRT
jgi:Domain of unknown function (DUF4129)